MKHLKGWSALAVLACLQPLSGAYAEDTSTAFRSPGDITAEERMQMMQGVAEYNNCVYGAGMELVAKFEDIRQAADAAMEQCENLNRKLHETIESFRVDPAFAEHFVHHTQSRAVRSLLPELAIRKSGN